MDFFRGNPKRFWVNFSNHPKTPNHHFSYEKQPPPKKFANCARTFSTGLVERYDIYIAKVVSENRSCIDRFASQVREFAADPSPLVAGSHTPKPPHLQIEKGFFVLPQYDHLSKAFGFLLAICIVEFRPQCLAVFPARIDRLKDDDFAAQNFLPKQFNIRFQWFHTPVGH